MTPTLPPKFKKWLYQADQTTLWRIHRLVEDLLAADAEEAPVPPHRPDHLVLEERRIGSKTYRLEKVRCGKPGCKSCPHPKKGKGYWYAYFRRGGKVVSEYVGKELPAEPAGV